MLLSRGLVFYLTKIRMSIFYTTPPTEINCSSCRYCNSENLDYVKFLHWGKIKTFHYGIKCKDCKRRYKVERNKFIYEKVKDKPWIYSKNALRKLNEANNKLRKT